MQFRVDPKTKQSLSALGFGCMRFARKGGKIDYAKAAGELTLALRCGLNYLDTAYIYGGSEAFLGRYFEEHGGRDEVFLATKLPHYLVRSPGDIEVIFQKQLARLKTGRIDYYLIHMLNDEATFRRLATFGIEEWIREKKKSGAIGSIGFSYHGTTPSFLALLQAYDWDFTQIQLNYVDEHTQAGVKGLRAAADKGLAVFVMEPLRGGRLADGLPEKAKRAWRELAPAKSPAAWGLSWVLDFPEVTCVLSGMNDRKQIEENLSVAEAALPGTLTAEEKEAFRSIRQTLESDKRIACTSCGYCQPCPQGVDIPACFRSYNIRLDDGYSKGLRDYLMCTAFRNRPSNASRCVGCGLCEERCPQLLPIRQDLKTVVRALEGLPYRLAKAASKRRF